MFSRATSIWLAISTVSVLLTPVAAQAQTGQSGWQKPGQAASDDSGSYGQSGWQQPSNSGPGKGWKPPADLMQAIQKANQDEADAQPSNVQRGGVEYTQAPVNQVGQSGWMKPAQEAQAPQNFQQSNQYAQSQQGQSGWMKPGQDASSAPQMNFQQAQFSQAPVQQMPMNNAALASLADSGTSASDMNAAMGIASQMGLTPNSGMMAQQPSMMNRIPGANMVNRTMNRTLNQVSNQSSSMLNRALNRAIFSGGRW